ncbi:hypothetical protein O6H91_07G074000 [Diphasiastrum complanatum]|uniref:Uncharacterized protein n=1 Tax=Diphasiastrum complanatum TaxID=34168 RepID=A0ACC2D6J2_DIPCM|nr:hypothetical protein O6H91_07G074000 [Diphasiastrum complanatum]
MDHSGRDDEQEDLLEQMRGLFAARNLVNTPREDRYDHSTSTDGVSSSTSIDGISLETLGEGDPINTSSDGLCGLPHGDDVASTSEGSSPLGWPLARRQRSHSGLSSVSQKSLCSKDSFMWEEKREKRETEASEVEMMKERFAKLLLGEDMSGGGKGVCTASAISNAITNLAASVFGQLWRLEPLSTERKAMWRREMEWLLSVSDYIVELIPSWQSFADGSNLEIMVSRPRSDLHINLPALRKLDTMLLETLDSFQETEFWYVDQGIAVSDKDNQISQQLSIQRQEEKWWLPTPKVPINGLSAESRKQLQYQREATSQILKAAIAINGQVLSEMEVPEMYWETLPKNGKSSLGEAIYRGLASEQFSPESLLSLFDLSTEHNSLEVANRIEAAIHVWRRKMQNKHLLPPKDIKYNAKSSWGKVKELVGDKDKRVILAERAESLLLSLRQRFPGLPQTILDMNKIQYNRDVGQSILESYSRVLESLAFNIISRIDDVIYTDDLTKNDLGPPVSVNRGAASMLKRGSGRYSLLSNTPYATPFASPSESPRHLSAISEKVSSSAFAGRFGMLSRAISGREALTGYPIGETNSENSDLKDPPQSPVQMLFKERRKSWSHADKIDRKKALNSLPGQA